MAKSKSSGPPKTTPKGEPRPYFGNMPDELLWERRQARGEEPWHPIDDCMNLVGRVLDPDRFDPAAWPDMGPPDPAWELKRLDPEGVCEIWMRNFLTPADAEGYRGWLDGLTRRWEGWKAAVVQRCYGTGEDDDPAAWLRQRWAEPPTAAGQRKPDLDATTDLTAWLAEPDNWDLWRELLAIRADAQDTCAYLRTLAAVIRAKEAKPHVDNATAGNGQSGMDATLRMVKGVPYWGEINLRVPTGKATDVFEKLLNNLGEPVTYAELGCEGRQPKEADDQTKQAVKSIRAAFGSEKVPYEVTNQPRVSYCMQPVKRRQTKAQ